MSRKKLLDDIRQNPARFYRSPSDVIRDRRFGDGERLLILEAWEPADDAIGIQIAETRKQIEDRAPVPAARTE
jgi:hypothetical protein